MKKIAKENLKLLNRLQDIKSSYDIGRMEDQRHKQENLLNNLCEYPHIFKDQKVLDPQTLEYKGSKLGLNTKSG